MLLWVKANFGPDLGVFITENGMALNETSTDDWNTRAVYHSVSTGPAPAPPNTGPPKRLLWL